MHKIDNCCVCSVKMGAKAREMQSKLALDYMEQKDYII